MFIFCSISILFAVMLLAVPAVGSFLVRRGRITAPQLTRSRLGAAVIGVPVLCWCAAEGALMLPPAFTPWVWAAVPVTAAACLLLLDFNAVRAFSGGAALLANFLIQHSFACGCALRGLFCSVVLVFGLAATALIAWPWLLRDALDWIAAHPQHDRAIWGGGLLCAAAIIMLPLFGG